jgi:hypothetical protein
MTKPKSVTKRPRAKAASARGELVIPAAMKPVVAAFAKAKGVAVEKGWGADSVALKVKGKIFAMLVRGDLVLKLPSAKVDELVRAGAKRFDPRRDGREMKEWAVLALDARDCVRLAREALEFVSGKRS